MKNWLWNQVSYIPAYFFILVYALKEQEVMWLFAASWVVIHAKGDEILEAIRGKGE